MVGNWLRVQRSLPPSLIDYLSSILGTFIAERGEKRLSKLLSDLHTPMTDWQHIHIQKLKNVIKKKKSLDDEFR